MEIIGNAATSNLLCTKRLIDSQTTCFARAARTQSYYNYGFLHALDSYVASDDAPAWNTETGYSTATQTSKNPDNAKVGGDFIFFNVDLEGTGEYDFYAINIASADNSISVVRMATGMSWSCAFTGAAKPSNGVWGAAWEFDGEIGLLANVVSRFNNVYTHTHTHTHHI
jgi:hypothetical protein